MTQAEFDKAVEALNIRLKDVDTRLSDKMRTLNLGVLAFIWAVMSATPTLSGKALWIDQSHHKWFFVTGCAAVTSLAMDLIQSVFNDLSVSGLLEQYSRVPPVVEPGRLVRLWNACAGFNRWIKLALCLGACASLVYLTALALLH